jgi:hypothetical protein
MNSINLATKKRIATLNEQNDFFSLDIETLMNQLIDEYEGKMKSIEELNKMLNVIISHQVKALLESNYSESANWEYIRIKIEDII